MKVIDPACGAGILLAALTTVTCGADRQLSNAWLSDCVYAADLSENALRGTLIALACHTDSVAILVKMRSRWRVQDSLIAGPEEWSEDVEQGFDVVVANPPWEKVKLTRHEFLQSEGVDRHYGASYSDFELKKYQQKKAVAESYGAQLVTKYPALRFGEPDLYVAFTDLLFKLAKPGASVGAIRSGRTYFVRRSLLLIADMLLHNRVRSF